MPRYRKRPIVIEAVCFDGDNIDELVAFCPSLVWGGDGIYVDTLEGDMRLDVGSYLIRGIAGEYYSCRGDIFDQTYELEELDESSPWAVWSKHQNDTRGA